MNLKSGDRKKIRCDVYYRGGSELGQIGEYFDNYASNQSLEERNIDELLT